MKSPVIDIDKISKRYTIRHDADRTDGLRHRIELALRNPFQWLAKRRAQRTLLQEEFWALKDISFQVREGEVVGIIGRNGAGKSTLLKVLSRITEPSTGRISLRGRVASLLEVGTGFHPELTGRENIFLNGAILGMSRAEIKSKFDEIVAFSEIEKFLDTPVKRYSSGMYVRLAFAVAAHLDPEILIVDEVLAVGDIRFQQKCLGKIQQISGQQGRTVLFVSHNMASVTRLCTRAISLERGQIVGDGDPSTVVRSSISDGLIRSTVRKWPTSASCPGDGIARLLRIAAHSEQPQGRTAFDIRNPIILEMTYEVLRGGHVLVPNYHVYNEDGVCVFIAQDLEPEWKDRPKKPGEYTNRVWIPGNFLAEGYFSVGAVLTTFIPMCVHFSELDAIGFEVVDTLEGNSARGTYGGNLPGIVRPLLKSETHRVEPTQSKPRSVALCEPAPY